MTAIKRAIAAMLLIVALSAPWKLMVVATEAMFLTPGYSRVNSPGTNQYWDALALQSRLDSLGWDVSYSSELIDKGMYGLTTPAEHTVQIEESLTWNGRYNILAHEGGHTIQPSWVRPGPQSEIFAESVAALMSKDGLIEHARYLSRFRQEIPTLVYMWPSIYHAAAVLQD